MTEKQIKQTAKKIENLILIFKIMTEKKRLKKAAKKIKKAAKKIENLILIFKIMTEKQLLKKAAKDIENLIKAKIKERNLIKTGRMYNSIKCTMDSSLSLSIKAVDYFQFVNERYNILGEVENTYEYQEIFEELMDELIGAEFGKDRKYKI